MYFSLQAKEGINQIREKQYTVFVVSTFNR